MAVFGGFPKSVRVATIDVHNPLTHDLLVTIDVIMYWLIIGLREMRWVFNFHVVVFL